AAAAGASEKSDRLLGRGEAVLVDLVVAQSAEDSGHRVAGAHGPIRPRGEFLVDLGLGLDGRLLDVRLGLPSKHGCLLPPEGDESQCALMRINRVVRFRTLSGKWGL